MVNRSYGGDDRHASASAYITFTRDEDARLCIMASAVPQYCHQCCHQYCHQCCHSTATVMTVAWPRPSSRAGIYLATTAG